MAEQKGLFPELSQKTLSWNQEKRKHDSEGKEKIYSMKNKNLENRFVNIPTEESSKENLLTKYLTPDLGSLTTFITLNELPVFESKHLQQSKIKKKKIENVENNHFTLKRQASSKIHNPLEYLYDDDEKKRRAAAKKIIDDIFKSIYGDDLDIIQKDVEERSMNKDPLFEENSIAARIVRKYTKKKEDLEFKFEIFQKYLEKLANDSQPKTQREKEGGNFKIEESAKTPNTKPIRGLMRLESKMIGQNKEKQVNVSLPRQMSGKFPDFNENIELSSREQKASDKKRESVKTSNFYSEFVSYPQPNAKAEKKSPPLEVFKEMILEKIKQKYKEINELFTASKPIYTKDDEINAREKYKLFKKSEDACLQEYTRIGKDYIKSSDSTFSYNGEIFLNPNEELFLSWNVKLDINFILYASLNISFQRLTKLEVYNANLQESALLILMEFILKENRSLRHLDFSKNEIKLRVADLLEKYIEKNNTLTVLRLAECGITSKIFCLISLGVAKSPYLEELNFSGNKIDDNGVSCISILVRYIKSLKEIDFSNNKISDFKGIKKTVLHNKLFKDKTMKF